MEKNDMNRSQLAQHLGVSKGYVSQLLNGDYDHKLSKFIELAIAFGYVPKIEFLPMEEVIPHDRYEYVPSKQNPNIRFIQGNFLTGSQIEMNPGYGEKPILKLSITCEFDVHEEDWNNLIKDDTLSISKEDLGQGGIGFQNRPDAFVNGISHGMMMYPGRAWMAGDY